MGLAHTFADWVNGDNKPIAISEAEIREELEFHLEMRSLDNRAAGMSIEEARRDAKKRFGDFDQQYEACRRVTLGLPLALRSLQRVLFVGLLVAVAFLGLALVRAQSAQTEYEAQLQNLRNQLVESQQPRYPIPNKQNRIPYVRWNPTDVPAPLAHAANTNASVANIVFSANTLDRPWSDWQQLAEESPASPQP